MKKRDNELEPSYPSAPGAFMPSGSWKEDAELGDRGPAHRLVVALCRARRFEGLAPARAAQVIEGANATESFPWWKQWATCGMWSAAWAGTSAEEAVKRVGRGANGHSCGELWAEGPESDCHDPRHKPITDRGELVKFLAEPYKIFDDRKAEMAPAGPIPPRDISEGAFEEISLPGANTAVREEPDEEEGWWARAGRSRG